MASIITNTLELIKKKTDRPLQLEDVTIDYSREVDLVNISWTATNVMGVNHSYKITFDSGTVVDTVDLYYVYQQSMFEIRCIAYVRAVNGAGESDPSNNVTIPSLPDIAPVTASLTHQVWKSNGQIMVNVSFEVSDKVIVDLK